MFEFYQNRYFQVDAPATRNLKLVIVGSMMSGVDFMDVLAEGGSTPHHIPKSLFNHTTDEMK